MKLEKRLSNEEIKARLVFIVAVSLCVVLMLSVLAMIYGVLFVVQPVEASELRSRNGQHPDLCAIYLGWCFSGYRCW
jgi:hypothetical protein